MRLTNDPGRAAGAAARGAASSDPPLIVIAAGGDGARIGGAKPARLLGGMRLIDRAVDWARRHSDAVAIAVRPGTGDWETGLPVLADATGGIGAITALASAMRQGQRLGRDTVLLVACDLPFLPDDLIPRLKASLAGHAAALPVSGGRLHPMAALWRCEPARLEAWIVGGGQSLWRYAREVGMVEVMWDQALDPFANVNDAEALSAAEQRLRALSDQSRWPGLIGKCARMTGR